MLPDRSTPAPPPRLATALLMGLFGALGAGAPPAGAAQPSTDVVVLDLNPHLDHVHVGSLVRVTDRDGYDNQPSFIDHDRLLFVSDREGGRSEVFLYTISSGSLERVTDTPDEAEYSPRVVPGAWAISVVRVEADGTSQHLVRYPAPFLDPAQASGTTALRSRSSGEGERLASPLDDIGYYAWGGSDRLAVYRVGTPPALHLVAPGGGEPRWIADGVGASVQSVPGTSEISFVDGADADRPVLVRLNATSGEAEPFAPLPPGALEHAWLSDVTAYLGHEGILYRSTRNADTPWVPILDLGEAVGSFSRIAVTSGGRRIAVVVERPQADGGGP